ncbi:protein of unknown function DUF493 [Denitrovibrio acetiphilus DSM 12809]|uniref:Uncharacterized protein n=1 Tax=Denitrovibrio acetiphilus (strain DSM 12809 / NBRC 114555 / N2460) TaxID=522772 RepID=D4H3Z7_DENA2|nr:DUF493 domain-containing protein [Denitrovibrio acetiphilus]ADD67308.1 protein of unknown function DUF493 [Denitrovibrio acetiphilus DSM 12809]
MSENLKEMLEFPVIYTFKAMGENHKKFICDVKSVFSEKEVESFLEKPSSKGNYISVSITVEINNFDELEEIYTSIKKIDGLKYHL